MIYSYNKIAHPIIDFHDKVISVFRNIFKYDLEVYDESVLVPKDFMSIVSTSKARFENPLKEIVLIYHDLPNMAKIQLQDALLVNNDVSCLCDKKKYLIKYDALHVDIEKPLKNFFTDLWEKYPMIEEIEETFGTVKSHYDGIIKQDGFDALICPFCGLEPFEPPEGTFREAYDHFLPKADYPFIAVNFDLLFPTCHKCNSNEKKDDDTLYHKNGLRRKMYNPYDITLMDKELDINIVATTKYEEISLKTLLNSIDWEIHMQRDGKEEEELETWDQVYGVKGRYFRTVKFFEKTWFGMILSDYKDALEDNIDFDKFNKRQLKKAKYTITLQPQGISKFLYYNYIFNLDNIEAKLYKATKK